MLGAIQLVFLYNMIVSWRFGPKADGQPLARQLDRVAGLLAAAGLQLRRDPARRRRPVRVRHPRRPSRDHGRRRRRGPGARADHGGLVTRRRRRERREAPAARLPERGCRRPQAAAGGARADRGRAGLRGHRRRAAEPADDRHHDRPRRPLRIGPRPGRGDDVDLRRTSASTRSARSSTPPPSWRSTTRSAPRGPREVLFSALYDTRFGIARKDLVEVAREIAEPAVKFTHIPVRVEEDAIRLDLSHVLVVATKTVNCAGPGLAAQRARLGPPAPLHDHLPAQRGRRRGAGRPRPRRDPRRALPRRRRRDRPADLRATTPSRRSATRSSTTRSTRS